MRSLPTRLICRPRQAKVRRRACGGSEEGIVRPPMIRLALYTRWIAAGNGKLVTSRGPLTTSPSSCATTGDALQCRRSAIHRCRSRAARRDARGRDASHVACGRQCVPLHLRAPTYHITALTVPKGNAALAAIAKHGNRAGARHDGRFTRDLVREPAARQAQGFACDRGRLPARRPRREARHVAECRARRTSLPRCVGNAACRVPDPRDADYDARLELQHMRDEATTAPARAAHLTGPRSRRRQCERRGKRGPACLASAQRGSVRPSPRFGRPSF